MSCVLPIPPSAPSRAEATTRAEENKAAGRSNTEIGSDEGATRSPAQLARDAACRAIRAVHRFSSFSPERTGNMVKWYVFVDGHDYMWAISELIDSAKEQINILDWWLSPEIYLRRPPEQYQEWRLDRLLLKKATQGVKVHIVVYNELPLVIPLNSTHTQATLESLHPNIAVMRNPDHTNPFSGSNVYFWSHHEKLVVVDNQYVSLGGLDLCFGRWDTHNHPLADAHPSQFNRTLFPGQDYNNSRVMDFKDVDQFFQKSLLNAAPLQPWHDVSAIMSGPSVLDAAQHFVERWNYIKAEKYATDSRYETLPAPHALSGMVNFSGSDHPVLKAWRKNGMAFLNRFVRLVSGASQDTTNDPNQRLLMSPTCNVQVCRSVTIWSHDVPTEQSIQNAYISMIHDAKHFIYIENQFLVFSSCTRNSISATSTGGPIVIVAIPEVPQATGPIKDSETIQIILGAQWRTINRAGSSIMELVKNAGYDPTNYITFYHLRSYDRINGATSRLQKIIMQSGVSYEQAQGALARIWLGDDGPKQAEGNSSGQNIVKASDTGKDGNRASLPIPPTVASAMEILNKFQAASTAEDKAVTDSVAGHALQEKFPLGNEQWAGTDAEKKDCYVSEMTYIHSKLMIVDDLRVILGSANLNDRSMKGNGDSEIAIVVEDMDMIDSKMDGQPYQASRFAATLRRALFKEHLGLLPPQPCNPVAAGDASNITSFMTPVPNAAEDTTQSPEDALVEDPVSDQFFALWNKTAQKNTEIFLQLFKIVPNNSVTTWAEYAAYIPNVSEGHVATDLSTSQITELLGQIKGHLVQGSVDFLIKEDSLVTGIFWSTWNFLLPIWV
ncbi:hypothetical protein M408DRAFT_71698 [Serendipita vermifera MAFF 305830]|uniref:Phospholipase n=1 Tax=Serendipita vermifera MAFF 305830 TaxID=933852 RepID=A0A0C3B4H1_SERVB|nr:hypothetical protein M408DRAFT_71698 [Serendipita vermifera MAFF 305830]